MKLGLFCFLTALNFATIAKASDMYLFYSAQSEYLKEIGITKKEVAKIFDGAFGPASDELPLEVREEDFYVAKYPDGKFVLILNAPFNCGKLGCNTIVFERDEDNDLIEVDSKKPVKCTVHDPDKLLCVDGGYKPEVKKQTTGRKILHFYPDGKK